LVSTRRDPGITHHVDSHDSSAFAAQSDGWGLLRWNLKWSLSVVIPPSTSASSGLSASMTRWSAEKRTRASFGLALAVLLIVALLAYQATTLYAANLHAVSRSQELVALAESLDSLINEEVAAVRGYLLTADQYYLDQEATIYVRIGRDFARAEKLLAGYGEQLDRLHRMHDSFEERHAGLPQVIERRRRDGPQAGSEILKERRQAQPVSLSRLLLDEIIAAERTHLAERAAAEHDSQRQLVIAALLLLFAIGAIFYLFSRRIVRDLNRQQDMMSIAERNEAFLESVIENLPDMVFVKDAQDLRFVRINAAGERLIGLPRDELIGKNDFDFWPEAEAEFFVRIDREVLLHREVVDIAEETLHTGSGERLLHTKKVPILDGRGEPLYLLGISEDITSSKEAERRILQLNAHLQSRTLELEAANNELESFTYSVSHDLRTPLRAIGSFSQLLEMEHGPTLNAEAQRYVSIIADGTRRMSALIDDLLMFARLGRQALGESLIDMRAVAADAAREVLEAHPEAGVRIEWDELPGAYGDASMIRQVWTNLIGNAVKYSARSDAPLIQIKAQREGNQFIYSVGDNGVGFDMKYYSKLFGVFQRLHSKDEFPGTGVGLAIVQRVVTRHGGRVWATSAPAAGATFFFTLHAQPRSDNPSRVVEKASA
jgi:PAS domain S-box-containing protein